MGGGHACVSCRDKTSAGSVPFQNYNDKNTIIDLWMDPRLGELAGLCDISNGRIIILRASRPVAGRRTQPYKKKKKYIKNLIVSAREGRIVFHYFFFFSHIKNDGRTKRRISFVFVYFFFFFPSIIFTDYRGRMINMRNGENITTSAWKRSEK